MDYYDYLLESMEYDDYDSYDYDDLDPVEEAFIEGYMAAMENISEERKAELNKKYGGKSGKYSPGRVAYYLRGVQQITHPGKLNGDPDQFRKYKEHNKTKNINGEFSNKEKQIRKRSELERKKITRKYKERYADRNILNEDTRNLYMHSSEDGKMVYV